VYCCEPDGLRFLVAQNGPLAQNLGHAAASDTLTRTRLSWSERSVATYVALTSATLNIPDVYHLPPTKPYAFNSRVDMTTGFRTVSMLVTPLRTPIRGVLQLINATTADGAIVPFSDADEALVAALASDPNVPVYSGSGIDGRL
jgi:hypothetical protein